MDKQQYIAACEEYRKILQHNIERLLALDEKQYPNLYKHFKHCRSINAKQIAVYEDGISKGKSLDSVSKSTLIRVFGQEQATLFTVMKE